MASGIKVKSLIASTAGYAKKSATAADKNKNGRLTRAEAKALPKDLQDDFKRQAKGKVSVKVADFAKDQTAYVARSANKADKNKDGLLSASEQAKMPKDLADNLKSFAAGSTKGGLNMGGVFLKPAAVPQGLSRAASDASLSYSAAFKGSPADVAAMAADPQGNKEFFNQLLFAATGTSYLKDYPEYYGPDGLGVSTTTANAAATEMVDDRIEPGTDRADFTAKMKAVTAELSGPNVKLFRALWTNNDDAAFQGVLALDTKSGAIRAAGWYNEP